MKTFSFILAGLSISAALLSLTGCDNGGNDHEPLTEPETAAFKVTVSDATPTSFHVNVVPEDKASTYITIVTEKSKYDSYKSEDECVQADMELIRKQAELKQKTFEEELEDYLNTGEFDETIGELEPETEYYAYAYGLSGSGTRTTAITGTAFSTGQLQMTDCKLDVELTQEYSEVTLRIVPSENDVKYFAGYTDEDTWNDRYFYKDGAFSTQKWFSNEIAYYTVTQGKTLDYALEQLTFTGENTIKKDLEAKTKYHFFVFAVNDEGYIISDVQYFPIETGDKRPSVNVIELSVDPATITETSASVTITVSNPEDKYLFEYFEKSKVDGKTDDEILALIKAANFDDYDYKYYYNPAKGNAVRPLNYLEAGKTYVAFACGYNGGPVAPLSRCEFSTLAKEPFVDVTFEYAEINGVNALVVYNKPNSACAHYYSTTENVNVVGGGYDTAEQLAKYILLDYEDGEPGVYCDREKHQFLNFGNGFKPGDNLFYAVVGEDKNGKIGKLNWFWLEMPEKTGESVIILDQAK